MNKQENAAQFLKEAEDLLKQAQAQTASPGVQITRISIDGCRVDDFPIALRTIGTETVVVRVDLQLSRADIRESLKFVQGVRVELGKQPPMVPDENRIRNAFRFYRDKVPPQNLPGCKLGACLLRDGQDYLVEKRSLQKYRIVKSLSHK